MNMVRNRILLVGVIFVALVSTALSKSVSIKGVIKNGQVYPTVYLFKCFGNQVEKIDSVALLNGSFEFKSHETMQRGFYKVGIDDKINLTFVYDHTPLVMDWDLSTNLFQITNSKENELFRVYMEANIFHQNEFKKLDEQAQKYMALRYSDPETFKVEINKLQLKLDTLNAILRSKLSTIVQGSKGTFMAKVAGMFISYDTTSQNSFFVNEEYTDPEYTRGEMLPNKITSFLQRYYAQTDLKVASYQVMSRFSKINPNKELAYIALINYVYQQQNTDYARTLAEQYGRDFPSSKTAQYYLDNLPKSMPQVGEIPPDIKLKDVNGKEVSLYSLKGKVVLLDFWASWCGPCRRENPNVVAAYQKFKDKGFTVFSVSLDSNKDQWLAAINKDGLVWPNHVSDLKGWSSGPAKLYGVRGIPAAFLIDKTGKVVGTNLRGAELEAALEKLFNQ